MEVIAFTAFAFFVSAVPYSLVIGRVGWGVDIRQYGDGNPGATNLYKATGSRFWYIVGVLADALKGALPVSIAYWGFGWTDWRVVPIGVVAIAGHAFSPFLGFKGGKAVAITGGVWTALTWFEVPIVFGLMLAYWYKQVRESDWVVMFTMLSVLLYLLLTRPTLPMLGVWAGNFAILLYKHRASLTRLPSLHRFVPKG